MNNIIKVAALFLLLSTFNFLLFAFYNATFDISIWTSEGRFLCCLCEMPTAWISCAVVYIQDNTI